MTDQANIQARIAERIHHEIGGLISECRDDLTNAKVEIAACDPSDREKKDMLRSHAEAIRCELRGLERASTAVYRALVSGGIIE